MEKKKQLKILCLALAFAIVIYAITVVVADMQAKKEAEESQISVINLEVSDIEAVSYTSYYGSFAFEKVEDEWTYTKDEEFPLSQSYMEDLISQICSITAERELKNYDDLSDYGLDSASNSISITTDDGETIELLYGDTTSNGTYYLTIADGDVIYITDGSVLESLVVDEDSLLELETFPTIDSDNIASLKIKEDGDVVYKCSDEEDETLTGYADQLSDISLDTCVTYNVTDSELKKYGLNTKDRITITAEYNDSSETQAITFFISEAIENNDSESVYLQLKGSTMVYQLEADVVSKFI